MQEHRHARWVIGCLFAVGACVWLGAGRTVAAEPPDRKVYPSGAVQFAVEIRDADWRDEKRNRDVPVRIYMPQQNAAPGGKFPVVVFSHGLGGSRANYGYFGQHMAANGYIVIAPTHKGSDTEQLIQWMRSHPQRGGKGAAGGEGWLQAAISDPDNLRNRPKDVSFILNHIAAEPTLRDIADLDRVGVAGHSFGAYTSMAVGGMTIDLPEGNGVSLRDPRVKVVLPMSPEGPGTMGITVSSWDSFAVPVLFLTGTNDYGSGGRSAAWRRAGFEHVRGVDDYLVTLNGAGHMTFGNGAGELGDNDDDSAPGGRIRVRIRERLKERLGERKNTDTEQELHIRMVQSFSSAFFDAYLKNDAAASEWLMTYFAEKHDECTAEFKPGK